mgnify:CR=1 FL=1
MAAGGGGDERGEAGGEAGAVGLVGGEVVELVEKILSRDREVAAVAREDSVGGAVAEADGAGGAVGVGRGEGGVENLQRMKTTGDERAEKIEGEDEGVVGQAGGDDACCGSKT